MITCAPKEMSLTTTMTFPLGRTLLRTGALAALIFLAGCGPAGQEAAPTALPTRTPVPTYTPTPESVAPPTPVPTATTTTEPTGAAAPQDPTTPTPQPTAAPAAQLTITGDLVNVRSGPGTTFDLVSTATAGESFAIVARNTAGDWWQVCCFAGQNGWVFGALAAAANADSVPVAADQPVAAATEAPTTALVADVAPTALQDPNTPTPQAAPPAAPYDPTASSAGNFDPNAQYQIVHFKVLGLDENNGGIRDSSAQHLIFLTVLDQNGAGVDGAVVRNLVGDKSEVVTGGKGPGKAEITMYYEPFKLAVASDPAGLVTSQVSNQMGLIFPHLPDIVGKLGDVNYEYGACPTIDIKCAWPLAAIHFSYEITFQKVK
jgi:uncharacterized protein YraI